MKFFFGEVLSFIADSATGLMASVINKDGVLGGLSTWVGNRLKVQTTLTGKDGFHEADVELVDGKPSLRTFGIQAIESLRGFDPQADVWFYIGTEEDSTGMGDAGDIITMIIAPTTDDGVTYPAINIPYTLLPADVAGTEDELAITLASYYNLQSPFKELWRAQRIAGNGVVYITSRRPGSQFERPNVGDFNVTASGTTVVNRAFDNIIRRNKLTGLARDPADPRNGQLGIQGSVTQTEGDITNRFQILYPDLKVDGSVTPVTFRVEAHPTDVKFINNVVISCRGNGIKYGQFLSKGGSLLNGLGVMFKSKDVNIVLEAIHTTDDLDDLFAGDPDNSRLSSISGGDKYIAILQFSSAVEIRPVGEFVLDDYFEVSVNDDITAGLTDLRLIYNGFTREF